MAWPAQTTNRRSRDLPQVAETAPCGSLAVSGRNTSRSRAWPPEAQRSRKTAARYARAPGRCHIQRPNWLDRQSWLARLADLVLDGYPHFRPPTGIDLGAWRRAMYAKAAAGPLKGLSHVFTSRPRPTLDDPTVIANQDCRCALCLSNHRYARRSKQLLMTTGGSEHRRRPARYGLYHMDFRPTWRSPELYRVPQQRLSRLSADRRPGPRSQFQNRRRTRPRRCGRNQRSRHHSPRRFPDDSAPLRRRATPAQAQYWAWCRFTRVGASWSLSHLKRGMAQSKLTFSTRSSCSSYSFRLKLIDSALTPNSAQLKFAVTPT